jgi:hypothetical protein
VEGSVGTVGWDLEGGKLAARPAAEALGREGARVDLRGLGTVVFAGGRGTTNCTID